MKGWMCGAEDDTQLPVLASTCRQAVLAKLAKLDTIIIIIKAL